MKFFKPFRQVHQILRMEQFSPTLLVQIDSHSALVQLSIFELNGYSSTVTEKKRQTRPIFQDKTSFNGKWNTLIYSTARLQKFLSQ